MLLKQAERVYELWEALLQSKGSPTEEVSIMLNSPNLNSRHEG